MDATCGTLAKRGSVNWGAEHGLDATETRNNLFSIPETQTPASDSLIYTHPQPPPPPQFSTYVGKNKLQTFEYI